MGRRAGSSSRDREEYAARERRARGRRAEAARAVGVQIEQLAVGTEMMGGRELMVGRLRTVMEAERAGDGDALRAAVVDLGAACAVWAAALDLGVASSAAAP